uniref:N/A n=1 Tax=Ganoderma boninense TaxID=34458 RepID=A0A5K1K1S8_9APHY|nr:N/A [Ganoderma boninense]
MIDIPQWFILSVVVVVALYKVRQSRSTSGKLPLPPSPPGYPIIGNFLDVPVRNMEPAFRDINAKFGEIVYLNACGQPMVVLGSHQAAIDLLEKRSSNYSDRLFSCVASLSGWTWLFSVNSYGAQWRRTRRLFHEYMHPNAVLRYRPIQEREAAKYLLHMLETPKDFLHHGRALFGTITIRVGYGIEVDKEKGTDYLGIAEKAMETFSQLFLPGKYLVESFPIMRFIPYPLPGTQFKRDAADCYAIVRKMRDAPWEAAMNALHEGRGLPSMASGLLERMAHLDGEAAAEEEEFSKNAIASAYAGGADTTLSTLQTFYIAMSSYPEIQKRAQAELEAVVGPHRLPTFADKNDLPYVAALIKECLRWRPVVPLALVHLSIEEDEYKGYRIPARSAVVANPWAYVRDPNLYPDPETFKPERFLKDGKLDPNVQDPTTIIFGYGRRICPGRYFAEGSVYAVVTAILHTMNIEAPRDAHGVSINLKDTVKMTHGVIS